MRAREEEGKGKLLLKFATKNALQAYALQVYGPE